MLRASHLPPITSPALSFLKLSLIPTFKLSSPPSNLHKFSTISKFHPFLPKSLLPNSPILHSLTLKQVSPMMGRPYFQGKASYSAGSSSESGREILVQHLLVKEDDLKLLVELQKSIAAGEDLSDLAVEYSICPSKEGGGMLGWVRKGQMVPEFEEAAFTAPLNKVVRCKTEFGWHLLQVLSEREEALLGDIEPDEIHLKMQDPSFIEEAQLIDVREPDEVEKASLPGFQVLPLRQFGSWGPEITTKFDPQKDTYVLFGNTSEVEEVLIRDALSDNCSCHHGMRSLQVAKWLQTQGFNRVFNVTGGIHAYSMKADPSIPTY